MKWLDNTLILGAFLTLVTSEKQYQKAMRHCGIAKADAGRWIKAEHANATSHFLDNPDGRLCCIVALDPKIKATSIQIACLLVHESVHIFQKFCERIGEQEPSAEFEAYSIQTISQVLMTEYAKKMVKH